MKRIFAIVLTVAMVLALTACGGGGEEDPTLGKYMGIQCEMGGIALSMEELYPGESYLELKNNGKAKLVLGDDQASGTWKLDGEEFELTVGGEKCPGTLKDGVVVIDFAGSGIYLTFRKETTGGSIADKLTENNGQEQAGKPAGPMGYYQGTTYTYNGQTFHMSDIYNGQCTLELMDGSKAVLSLGGEEMPCTWQLDGEDFSLDNQAVVSIGTLKDGIITLDFMNMGMIMTFEKDNTPSGGSADRNEASVFPVEFISDHDGDWHGMAVVYEGVGDFADEQDLEMEIIARLAFRPDGTCEPYLACALGGDDNNFKNLSAQYHETEDMMLLRGEFVNAQITNKSNLFVQEGVLYVDVFVDDGAGNTMNLYGCLRRLDDPWNRDADWPCLPESAEAFYKGKSFLEIAELFQLDVAEIPELTWNSAGGNSDNRTGDDGNEAAQETVDYETLAEVYGFVLDQLTPQAGWISTPYEDVVEMLGGVEGTPDRLDLWSDTLRFYCWYTPEGEYICLRFSFENGVWGHSASSHSQAFKVVDEAHGW